MYHFSQRSLKNLEGVDKDLKELFMRAIVNSPYDFVVTEGLRTLERQEELVRAKKSWTMKSYHLNGRAVDICILIDCFANWDYKNYLEVAKHIKRIAEEMQIKITWGGDWKQVDACHFQIEKNKLELALNEDMDFYLIEDYKYKDIEIPKGFKTDLASIPKFLWSLISPLEKHSRAAVIHDFLYSSLNKDYSRKDADKIFLEVMKKDGVPFLKRLLMYGAVRIFGKMFFKKED